MHTASSGVAIGDITLQSLVAYLEARGNVVSPDHRSALKHLTRTLGGYLCGTEAGRRVFSLDPGLGKTSALVALAATLHRSRLPLPFSVAASQVSALSTLKRDMIAQGVPESWIGLRHSMTTSEVEAAGHLPSTADESRVIQLVTHERIKQGRTRDLFLLHDGQPRRLCVWDETLLKSTPFARTAMELRQAIASAVEGLTAESPAHVALLKFFADAKAAIIAAEQRVLSDRSTPEVTFSLPILEGVEQRAATDILTSTKKLIARELLLHLLDLADLEQVRMMRDRDATTGILSYRIVVPEELRNIVVLDASWSVRELVKLDDTIEHEESVNVKRYDSVTYHRMHRAGGRSTAAGKASKAYAAEAAEVIAARPNSNVLVFTFMERIKDETQQRDVWDALSGREIKNGPAVGIEGRKRINVTHWGRETSVNEWDHCDTVILLGVLRRDDFDLMAHVKGQLERFDADASAHLEDVRRGETLHMILQASLRGCARKTTTDTNGKATAKPMDVYVIHKSDDIEVPLSAALPGCQWMQWLPLHGVPEGDGEKTNKLAVVIRDFLLSLPSSMGTVSTVRIKRELEDVGGTVSPNTFTKSLQRALRDPKLANAWRHEGRSVVHMFA